MKGDVGRTVSKEQKKQTNSETQTSFCFPSRWQSGVNGGFQPPFADFDSIKTVRIIDISVRARRPPNTMWCVPKSSSWFVWVECMLPAVTCCQDYESQPPALKQTAPTQNTSDLPGDFTQCK